MRGQPHVFLKKFDLKLPLNLPRRVLNIGDWNYRLIHTVHQKTLYFLVIELVKNVNQYEANCVKIDQGVQEILRWHTNNNYVKQKGWFTSVWTHSRAGRGREWHDTVYVYWSGE